MPAQIPLGQVQRGRQAADRRGAAAVGGRGRAAGPPRMACRREHAYRDGRRRLFGVHPAGEPGVGCAVAHMTQRGRSPVWRFATLIVLLWGFGAAAALGLTPGPVALAETAHRAGPFTPLVVIAGMSVLLAALVPRTVLGVAAGLLFGAAVGALYVLAAALIGAGIAFGLGRILGREFIAARPQRLLWTACCGGVAWRPYSPCGCCPLPRSASSATRWARPVSGRGHTWRAH